MSAFSPDSRLLAVDEMDDDYTTAVKLFDVATGQAVRSFPIDQQPSGAGLGMFSPDGKLFVISQRAYPKRGVWGHWSSTLRFFAVSSGAGAGSFPLDEDDTDFGALVFASDGRTLATTHWRGSQSRLFLYDVRRQALAHTVVLREEKAIMRDPVFSPNGQWVAVATQVIPDELQRDLEIRAEDVEQPRIHLVDVATGEIRETLILPQGFTTSGCFSPDGKTLATAGLGRVLLWDMSTPPGE